MQRSVLAPLVGLAFVCIWGLVRAEKVCYMGQEPDESQGGRRRWVMSGTQTERCACTSIRPGPLNTVPLKRTHQSFYTDTPIFTSNQEEIHHYFDCHAVHVCTTEGPMGMEDGRIPDSSLTASSKWKNRDNCGPQRARLNIKGFVGSWVARDDDAKPWIQVDFQTKVHMTGVITQGRDDTHDQWVREYQVAFSQDGGTWTNVADAESAPITFTGNTDRNTEVTNRFPAAVTARYLRIYPTTARNVHRSMRFEVIGCAPTSTQP